jgi:hypothetical protein
VANSFGAREDPRGELELLGCAACGLTSWFARGVVGDAALKAYSGNVSGSCVGCGAGDRYALRPFSVRTWSDRADVWTLQTRPRPLYFGGMTLTAAICRACGLMQWDASHAVDALTSTTEDGELRALSGNCGLCGAERRVRVSPVRRHDERILHLCRRPGIVFDSWVGTLAAEICGYCADVAWRAEGLDRLEPDEQIGVARLSGRGGLDQGPYR